MIMLCERCFAPVADGEPAVRLAHIDGVLPDGTVVWVHSYLHGTPCLPPRPGPGERPDTGAWNPARGIGSRRT